MKYSQAKAMFAITKASLRSILRSPSAVVFSFVFPFIFIIVFGFIGNGGGMQKYNVVMATTADTNNLLALALKKLPVLNFKHFKSEQELKLAQQKGSIAGIIDIQKNKDTTIPYTVKMYTTNSSDDQWPQVKSIIKATINEVSNNVYKGRPSYAVFNFDAENTKDRAFVREYKTIDFILPGQLGFSLLSAGVFGVAFTFFNLRNTMVLKRFFATPINRTFIILGEGLSRVIFQMITAVVIIGVGYLFFGFTLVHGWYTLFEMLFLSFIGLVIFMGFGFIVSGLAKSDSTIPPFANLITLPQFLLGGTFFSVDNFPKWLQPISKALPLTHLNTAMRAVAFEGQNLWDVKVEIGILLLWGLIVYLIAVKVFKWE